jgi:hypothetical protein
MQVAYKNKAYLKHLDRIDCDDEEFDMSSGAIPDLGLGNHVKSTDYQAEVRSVTILSSWMKTYI